MDGFREKSPAVQEKMARLPVIAPVVILAMPRSGSSMTAGIFRLHGFWEGRCRNGDRLNPKGYHENLDAKEILIRRFGRLAQTTSPAKPQKGFKTEILKRLNPEGKWFVKHSAMYRRAWFEFEPKFVCVRRSREGIIRSNLKTGFLGTADYTEMNAIVSAHESEMDSAPNAVNVWTDAVVNGDYRSIAEALSFCGVVPDLKKISDFVDPGLWSG